MAHAQIGIVVSILFLLGIASVGIAQATPDRTVRATGDEQFVPNVKIMATLRWSPGPLTVKSGATVTWVNEHPDIPHTISIVAEADVPDGIDALFNCPVCNAILAAHFPAGPPVPVVDVGAAGLDTVGNSALAPTRRRSVGRDLGTSRSEAQLHLRDPPLDDRGDHGQLIVIATIEVPGGCRAAPPILSSSFLDALSRSEADIPDAGARRLPRVDRAARGTLGDRRSALGLGSAR